MRGFKKGFSLIELLIVIAISSVLLLLATDSFIIGAVKSGNNYNKEMDLQSGVKSSMDNVKNLLKKSVQVHLVGKEVYTPDMNLAGLDSRYNYIAFRNDGGHSFLANIVYDKASSKFNVVPLISLDKKDNLKESDLKFDLEFYKNDSNYKDKMDKDVLNLTVKGVSKSKDGSDKKEFELTEDLLLQNVNQILISRHLQGNIKDITAIAYDEGFIRPGKKLDNRLGLVFIIDASSSMKHTISGLYPNNYGLSHYTLKTISPSQRLVRPFYGTYTDSDIKNPASEAATRKVVLGDALQNGFLKKVNDIAKDKSLNVHAYIFPYTHRLVKPKNNGSTKYFYLLNELNAVRNPNNSKIIKFGPYHLEKDSDYIAAKAYVASTDACGMSYLESDHTSHGPVYGDGTNTGWGMLLGLEIMKQMKDQGIENRFFILLSDGVPTSYPVEVRHSGYKNMIKKSEYKGHRVDSTGGTSDSMKYIKELTKSSSGLNDAGAYKKAYLIGFSSLDDEKKKMGFNNEEGSISHSLRQTGNEVQTYDAKDRDALNEALEKIATDIGVNIGVFDGPDKMRVIP